MNTGLVKPILKWRKILVKQRKPICDDRLVDIFLHAGSRIMKERKKERHEALKEQTNKLHESLHPGPGDSIPHCRATGISQRWGKHWREKETKKYAQSEREGKRESKNNGGTGLTVIHWQAVISLLFPLTLQMWWIWMDEAREVLSWQSLVAVHQLGLSIIDGLEAWKTTRWSELEELHMLETDQEDERERERISMATRAPAWMYICSVSNKAATEQDTMGRKEKRSTSLTHLSTSGMDSKQVMQQRCFPVLALSVCGLWLQRDAVL